MGSSHTPQDPPPGRVVVVATDAHARERFARVLGQVAPVDVGSDPHSAQALVAAGRGRSPRLVVVDLYGESAEPLCAAVRGRSPGTEVLAIGGPPSVALAVAAMRAGARDVLYAPFADATLRERALAILGKPPLLAPAPAHRPQPHLVSESPSMQRTLSLARRVAGLRSTVLLTGETGTGKEILTDLIHAESAVEGPLVRVNCAALPETLLESELFGHERGAFTGAERRRIGRFEQAGRGTLLLDEIGELATSTQVKLLRVLQQREFQRLGGVATLHTDARIVAATNRDLHAAMRSGQFREDLYFRLNVVGIHLAPLRDRPADIPGLAEHLVAELCASMGVPPLQLSPGALAALREAPWPGNVRQLRNALERAIITCRPPRIDVMDLAHEDLAAEGSPPVSGAAAASGDTLTLADAERELVERALDRAGYVQKEAARLLGVSRRKLNYMIRKMGVTHPSWRRNRAPDSGVEESPSGEGLRTARSDVY